MANQPIEAPIVNICRFRRHTGDWFLVSTDPGTFNIPTPFPLLRNHDPKQRIGWGVRYRRSTQGVIYAEFEITDPVVRDAIGRGWKANISPLFRILSQDSMTANGVRSVFYKRWELQEVSIVPQPANPTVGFGRSGIALPGESATVLPDVNKGVLLRRLSKMSPRERQQFSRLRMFDIR